MRQKTKVNQSKLVIAKANPQTNKNVGRFFKTAANIDFSSFLNFLKNHFYANLQLNLVCLNKRKRKLFLSRSFSHVQGIQAIFSTLSSTTLFLEPTRTSKSFSYRFCIKLVIILTCLDTLILIHLHMLNKRAPKLFSLLPCFFLTKYIFIFLFVLIFWIYPFLCRFILLWKFFDILWLFFRSIGVL